jgi:hypothetical protein
VNVDVGRPLPATSVRFAGGPYFATFGGTPVCTDKAPLVRPPTVIRTVFVTGFQLTVPAKVTVSPTRT